MGRKDKRAEKQRKRKWRNDPNKPKEIARLWKFEDADRMLLNLTPSAPGVTEGGMLGFHKLSLSIRDQETNDAVYMDSVHILLSSIYAALNHLASMGLSMDVIEEVFLREIAALRDLSERKQDGHAPEQQHEDEGESHRASSGDGPLPSDEADGAASPDESAGADQAADVS